MQQQWTISQLDCDVQWKVDFIQPSITSSVVGQRRSSKALPKGKLAPKKDHGHCLGVCCGQSLVVSLIHYSCLNLGETITSEKYTQQIDEMHWKLQCLQLALLNRKVSVLLHNTRLHVTKPTLQKVNELGYKVLPHPPYSPDLSPTNYHFFKGLDNFLQRKCFYNQQEGENAFQEFLKSRGTNFYTTRLNKLNSLWQKCVDCNGSYFD